MPRLLSTKVILFLFFLTALDMSVVPFLYRGSGGPIFSYLFVIYTAFEWHWTKTFPAALMAGILRDLLSIQFFGAEILALGLGAFALIFIIQNISSSSWVLRLIGTILFVTVVLSVLIVFHAATLASYRISWSQISACFFSALMTALLMPPFFFVARMWFQSDSYRSSAY